MEIVEIGQHNYSIWDELVNNSPDGTIFHSYQWLETCSRLTGKKLLIYLCTHNGKPVGGCPLFVKDNRIFRSASSGTELNHYSGLLLMPLPGNSVRGHQTLNNEIIRSITGRIEQNNFADVKLVNVPSTVDVRPFAWAGWSVGIRYAFHYIPDGDVYKKMCDNTQKVVKRAVRNNVTVKKEYDPELFLELDRLTYSRQRLDTPTSPEYLKTLMDMAIANGQGEMWIARIPSGEAIAGEFVLTDDKRAYRWVAVLHPEYRESYGATSLLLYEIFKDMTAKGYKEVNLMSANMPKIAWFVSGFNPRLVPFYTVSRTKNSLLIGSQIITTIRTSMGGLR